MKSSKIIVCIIFGFFCSNAFGQIVELIHKGIYGDGTYINFEDSVIANATNFQVQNNQSIYYVNHYLGEYVTAQDFINFPDSIFSFGHKIINDFGRKTIYLTAVAAMENPNEAGKPDFNDPNLMQSSSLKIEFLNPIEFDWDSRCSHDCIVEIEIVYILEGGLPEVVESEKYFISDNPLLKEESVMPHQIYTTDTININDAAHSFDEIFVDFTDANSNRFTKRFSRLNCSLLPFLFGNLNIKTLSTYNQVCFWGNASSIVSRQFDNGAIMEIEHLDAQNVFDPDYGYPYNFYCINDYVDQAGRYTYFFEQRCSNAALIEKDEISILRDAYQIKLIKKNPVSDYLILEQNYVSNDFIHVQIFNLAGKEIRNTRMAANKFENRIDLKTLDPGIYSAVFNATNFTQHFKFVKL